MLSGQSQSHTPLPFLLFLPRAARRRCGSAEAQVVVRREGATTLLGTLREAAVREAAAVSAADGFGAGSLPRDRSWPLLPRWKESTAPTSRPEAASASPTSLPGPAEPANLGRACAARARRPRSIRPACGSASSSTGLEPLLCPAATVSGNLDTSLSHLGASSYSVGGETWATLSPLQHWGLG